MGAALPNCDTWFARGSQEVRKSPQRKACPACSAPPAAGGAAAAGLVVRCTAASSAGEGPDLLAHEGQEFGSQGQEFGSQGRNLPRHGGGSADSSRT